MRGAYSSLTLTKTMFTVDFHGGVSEAALFGRRILLPLFGVPTV
jgi:hypothetical protein